MRIGALAAYEQALRDRGPLGLHTTSGHRIELDMARYLADADAADTTVLERCVGPVLDVGCGPGRIVGALTAAGTAALGVDIADAAVEITLQRGALALARDIFSRLPGEGRWRTVLVLDGNCGIGGDVPALLRRMRELTASDGTVILEAATSVPGTDEVLTASFSTDGEDAPTFPWAVASADVLQRYAEEAGLALVEHWTHSGRDFLMVRSDSTYSTAVQTTTTAAMIPKFAT
ncbi:methyltransferase domain-containing protein [Allobranchiibius sp. GilTou73]|uniref:methyltransferase domain-containing protein n=1 Tax=Allobranchiibius sp. GilTou73 TaxID=2904523 RepID=UPI001F475931|nr:methyltransferase domain-containing protein [Allobranchiibius sp. GilTou73]UIJ36087.1 class I SAM-dependent methyltransferase [Allobranchiibius sp. GilTou73]